MSGITIFTYAIHLFLAVGGSIWDIWLDFEQALEGDYKIITSVMIFWSWLLASTWNLIFCLTFNIWSEHRLYPVVCSKLGLTSEMGHFAEVVLVLSYGLFLWGVLRACSEPARASELGLFADVPSVFTAMHCFCGDFRSQMFYWALSMSMIYVKMSHSCLACLA